MPAIVQDAITIAMMAGTGSLFLVKDPRWAASAPFFSFLLGGLFVASSALPGTALTLALTGAVVSSILWLSVYGLPSGRGQRLFDETDWGLWGLGPVFRLSVLLMALAGVYGLTLTAPFVELPFVPNALWYWLLAIGALLISHPRYTVSAGVGLLLVHLGFYIAFSFLGGSSNYWVLALHSLVAITMALAFAYLAVPVTEATG